MITSRDEQIKSAGDIIAYGCSDELKDALEMDFPELKESEDERMRKAIIKSIKQFSTEWLQSFGGASKKEMLAWLERQKEPEDKGEVSDGYHTFNELYYYRLLYNAAFFNLLPKEWVHKSKRHHNGEECFGGGWFIVMANLPTGQISNHYELKDWDLFQIPEKIIADEWDGHTPQEAADRLHKYLLEKPKEQKDYNKLYEDIAKSEWFKKSYVGKSLGGEDMQKPADRPEDIHNRGYVKGVEDAYNNVGEAKVILKKLAKDKPKPTEWSEEDKDKLNRIYHLIGVAADEHAYSTTCRLIGDREAVELQDFLKALRPQPKLEWSEEDKYIFNKIMDWIVIVNPTSSIFEKLPKEQFIARLESLCPKSHWKPSEEQMKALYCAIQTYRFQHNVKDKRLNSLYNDLQKL